MLIDWFTVAAQALNFLILVWLLKRFLYRPILDAIDAREQRIAAELADADAQRADVNEQRQALAQEYAVLAQRRDGLLAQARDDANAERQRLLETAHQAIALQRRQWQEALRSDAQNLEQTIGQRTQQEVFAIARKALAELATTDLETEMCKVFIRRLRALDGAAKDQFAAALASAAKPAILRTAFDLPPPARASIQAALDEIFAAPVRLQFETAPALVSGIELSSNGQKIDWSIDGFLGTLEQGVGELILARTKDKLAPASHPEVEAGSTTEAPASDPAPTAPRP